MTEGMRQQQLTKMKKRVGRKGEDVRLLEALTDLNILLYSAFNLDRQTSDAIKRCAK